MKKSITYLTFFTMLFCASSCSGPLSSYCIDYVKDKHQNADVYKINGESEKYLIVDTNKVLIVYCRCLEDKNSRTSFQETIMEVPQKHK